MWSGEVSSVLWATFTEFGYWVFFFGSASKTSHEIAYSSWTFPNVRKCTALSIFFGFFLCSKRTQGQTSLIELATGTGSYRRVTLYSDIACKRPRGFTLPTRKWMSRVWGICAWVLWGKWFHMLHFQSQTSMFRWRPLCSWFMPAFVMLHKLTECVFL